MAKELPLYAQRLREARKKAGLTQAEVCERLDISLSTYRRYEQGITEPKSTVFFEIIEAINPSKVNLMQNMHFEEQELSQKVKDRIAKLFPIVAIPDTFDEATYTANLLRAFNMLNNTGKRVAVERTEELASIPQYKKDVTEE